MESRIPTYAPRDDQGVTRASLTYSNVKIVKNCKFDNGSDTEGEVPHLFRIVTQAIDAHVINIHLYEQVLIVGTAHNTTGKRDDQSKKVQKHLTVRINGNGQKRGQGHIAVLPDNAEKADQSSNLDPNANHHSFAPS